MLTNKRIKITGTDIYIAKAGFFAKKTAEYMGVVRFTSAIPQIKVFENDTLLKTFTVETLSENADLTAQYFHISVRIMANGGVMIDGIISDKNDQHPHWQDESYEAIRLQPFFLSTADTELSKQLVGKGLFDRGLHYSGTVTPTGVRAICICDRCDQSFSIQHIHAGFSDSQYFYSNDSRQTLIVGYYEDENMPRQLQDEVDKIAIAEIEAKLPKPKEGSGKFRYYNSFRCPHCLHPFIDFERYPQIRPTEYYANKLINDRFCTMDEKGATS